jgi:hypothetical protein
MYDCYFFLDEKHRNTMIDLLTQKVELNTTWYCRQGNSIFHWNVHTPVDFIFQKKFVVPIAYSLQLSN